MTDPTGTTPGPNWLVDLVSRQRWYGANDQRVVGARFSAREAVTSSIDWVLLNLHFQPGPNATYQLFLDDAARADVTDRPEVVRWLFPDLAASSVRLLPGEQSNTSLIVDGDVIVKVFRRLTREPNPDVEAVRRLWEVGYRSVPEPLGEAERDGRDLAVARRFMAGAASGWDLATAAGGGGAFAGGAGAFAGGAGAFADSVADLGRVTAELHVAMADAFGGAGEQADPRSWADALSAQLARVELGELGRAVAERYAALARIRRPGPAIRIHGDYHLGQVLRWAPPSAAPGWYVLDFEGEPARPVAERIAPSSALRDVAGMLRSFSYAAAVGGHPAGWEDDVRRRFLDAYLGADAVRPLLPDDPEPVLAAFELDKAVYEVAYERANRPEWEPIPLAAVRRLVDGD